MVARKPLPRNANMPPTVPPQEPPQDVRQPQWTAADPELDDSMWGDLDQAKQRDGHSRGDTGITPDSVPSSLQPGAPANYSSVEEDNVWVNDTTTPTMSNEKMETQSTGGTESGGDFIRVPTVLRPGGGAERSETNPFKRKMPAGAGQDEPNRPEAPTHAPPLPPFPDADAFSQLHPALDENKEPPPVPPVPGVLEQETGKDVWDSANSPGLLSLPSDEGFAGWEEEGPRKEPLSTPLISLEEEEAAKPLPMGPADDWNLIEFDAPPGPPPRQSTWENFSDDENDAPISAASGELPVPGRQSEDTPPQLPPRKSADAPPPTQPPRPVAKSETYQIKNINWHDVTAARNPRTSPILVQNANGPCPLVALVNALSLTTPADKTNTVLVETLRSREQVSLGLLLEAVFDELMSERRLKPGVDLPDVAELYDFLKGLHTGMNVNPRFIPTPDDVNAFKRTSLTHLHPAERVDGVPGTFEHTREMELYATFSIPLIHGWLPSKDDAVHDSFARQAASYEDTQNLLFREEELEEKLSSSHHQGLTEDEQQIYQDILTIKSYLSISATQLTPWGLSVIRKSMRPGSVAILFRNDHFSTLYRHPQTQELLTLVTDAGYANHPEVVWESLSDVNGERTEYFSGDFRIVGGASHDQTQQGTSSHDNGNASGWTTVQPGRRGRNAVNEAIIEEANEPPTSPTYEQEDRDLALALQLQEEEDERHRAEQERRRRESMLSEQFIEQQANTGPNTNTSIRGGGHSRGAGSTSSATLGPTAPARRSSNGVNSIAVTSTSSRGGGSSPSSTRSRPTPQPVRSLIPPATTTPSRPTNPRGPDEGVDDAPPSYEQAAQQTPYVPPAGHPSHPGSNPTGEAAEASASSSISPAKMTTTNTMGLIPNWYPPNRENYEFILTLWTWFPIFASLQWLVSFYGMGKTSIDSRLNLPGRIGWLTMECPGFLTLLYTLHALGAPDRDLPWQNQVLAALFVIHYSYRAVLFPLLQPSMSPIHATVWASALAFQLVNGTCVGAWLAAYGPTTQAAWRAQLGKYSTLQFTAGIAIFYLGLAANYYHDDELREIRRREIQRLQRLAEKDGAGKVKAGGVEKHYEIPQAGLFKWVEWFGFYMAAGWGCVPARCFLVNEITSMLPRAVKGRRWYAEKFGEDKIRGRWAVIPGVW
ncbi:hypothetical protein B0T22DRAFT_500968 [Podospora appendiculata]|uniref:MINDY deubiquitinase domain-containing protein n=1 Tax=Podospora appendiculata TaxID=314037 RepID=A0AAE0X2E4_9PEZI|nr:hypothetical protein B0T22DRAFT_500968 [Podospora appendiculata]